MQKFHVEAPILKIYTEDRSIHQQPYYSAETVRRIIIQLRSTDGEGQGRGITEQRWPNDVNSARAASDLRDLFSIGGGPSRIEIAGFPPSFRRSADPSEKGSNGDSIDRRSRGDGFHSDATYTLGVSSTSYCGTKVLFVMPAPWMRSIR